MTEDEIQTTDVVTTMIDTIALYGNRGHFFGFDPRDHSANLIVCVDGFRLSVIAGGGTYSYPKPAFCTCAFHRDGILTGDPDPAILTGAPWEVDHDFPGPYSAVEVMLMTDPPEPDPWEQYEAGSVYAAVPVELVRDLIRAHGGEIEKPDSDYREPAHD